MQQIFSLRAFFTLALGLSMILFLAACAAPDSSSETSDAGTSSERTTAQKVADAIAPSVYAESDTFVYEDYTQETFNSIFGQDEFAVFVYSTTCGSCAKKNEQIIDEVEAFGGGAVLKLEHGTNSEFEKQYGVVKYDTFVVFDAKGNHTTLLGGDVAEVRNAIAQ